MDDQNREILSFIEGEVPENLGKFDDRQLTTAALLIRKFHDATVLFPGLQKEVICHGDLSPCNFVFRSDYPVAMIDFDTVKEGTRMEDLSYAAWLWLDLGGENYTPAEQGVRLLRFLNAYGLGKEEKIIDAIILEQTLRIAQDEEKKDRRDFVLWAKHCRKWTESNRKEISSYL